MTSTAPWAEDVIGTAMFAAPDAGALPVADAVTGTVTEPNPMRPSSELPVTEDDIGTTVTT